MNRKVESVWIYLVEVVAAAFLLFALNLLCGKQQLFDWKDHHQAELTNLLLGSVAATGITFAAFFAVLTTDFGLVLRRAGEAKFYSVAFGFPLLLFFMTFVGLTFGNSEWGWVYNELIVFLLIYSGINIVTMVKNVTGLVGLWQDVDRARRDDKRPN